MWGGATAGRRNGGDDGGADITLTPGLVVVDNDDQLVSGNGLAHCSSARRGSESSG